jgi:tRNA dimethylallyltransferase
VAVTVRVAAIVGPTAVGKSAAAVEVASRIDAEIVSVDSMQLYRGMDVGTDKPPLSARRRVAHHLLDVFEPSRPASVAEFQSLARCAIEDIARRGRVPLLVGGSGLYFRAVVDDLRFPPSSPQVRASLEAEAERIGAKALHERLARADPATAARIAVSNVRRTVRALEVVELTGARLSESDSEWRYDSIYELRAAGLRVARPELRRRIDERVRRMLEAGLVAETGVLERRGLGPTARQALGYRQVLDAGARGREQDLRDSIARATFRFARRQESWFGADPRITWFDAGAPGLIADVVSCLSK